MLWAAEGKDVALEKGLTAAIYNSEKHMF